MEKKEIILTMPTYDSALLISDLLVRNNIIHIQMCVGAFSLYCTKDVTDKGFYYDIDKDEFSTEQQVYNLKNKYGISIFAELANYLDSKELFAIIYHEVGHIVNGDLIQENKTAALGAAKIIDNIQYEINADNYAINKVGAKYMLKSLYKSIKFLLNGRIQYKIRAKKGLPPKFKPNGIFIDALTILTFLTSKPLMKRTYNLIKQL